MDTLSAFEQLANTAYHDSEFTMLVNHLPTDIQDAFMKNDSQQLRTNLSGQYYFPDSRTVTKL